MQKVMKEAVQFVSEAGWNINDRQLALALMVAAEQVSPSYITAVMEAGAGKTVVAALLLALKAAEKLNGLCSVEELFYLRCDPYRVTNAEEGRWKKFTRLMIEKEVVF